jgi:hypothetical protein
MAEQVAGRAPLSILLDRIAPEAPTVMSAKFDGRRVTAGHKYYSFFPFFQSAILA